jgi:hypothetical protein
VATSALTLPGVELPPYSLRLDVNVWGFDVSTRRISLGVVQGHGLDEPPEVGWFSLTVDQLGGGAQRLAGLHASVPPFLRPKGEVAPPALIVAEQPYGQGKSRPHPQSYYVVGVLLGLCAVQFPEAKVDVIDPSSWKRDALGDGSGFAKKPQILAWAQATLGYPGDCRKCHAEGNKPCDEACIAHDEADCLGVVTSTAIRWASDHPLR